MTTSRDSTLSSENFFFSKGAATIAIRKSTFSFSKLFQGCEFFPILQHQTSRLIAENLVLIQQSVVVRLYRGPVYVFG